MKSVLLLLVSLLFTGLALADADLRVAIVSSQIQGSTELGKTHVDGLGEVSFVGSKNGNQVVVHAQDAKGEVIGKAETVIGLMQTPIYVLTSDGLKKITIYWGSD
jgi:hypothetical protein